jgi:hypothetical protein
LDSKDDRLVTFHFGPKVTDALRNAYRFDRRDGQYFIYLPVKEEKDKSGGR